MAVDDALNVILSEWDDIEPLLTVSELTTLASVSRETMRGRGWGRASVVFDIISAALPAGHAAWPALQSRPGPAWRSFPAGPPDLELIGRAERALASPWAAADAEADSLAEESQAMVLRHGTAPGGIAEDGSDRWLAVRSNGQMLYPLFQFASAEPYRQHDTVGRLMRQVGAADDPWGAAAWWLTPNAWLSAIPADLLGTSREPEIAYAADQLGNDNW
jgi:hypothetical protein